jgi:predicted amidohydrolase YtcJ
MTSGQDGGVGTIADADTAISGFVDHHAHLLTEAAGTPFPWHGTTVRAFHEQVRRDGTTPMDVPETPGGGSLEERVRRLYWGLGRAATVGLVEITEMGMRHWWYLDALASFGQRPLPVRVRVYLASGLAERSVPSELDARRADCGPWVRLEGVKFYADGWLVPRTCAMCRSFDDEDSAGILFQDSSKLARRIEPFAAKSWRIATHAIGDRAVEAVLDAYDMTWGGDRRAIAAAMPRIEHGSVLPEELTSRIAAMGVAVCIQPSFPVTDAAQVPVALGPGRTTAAYPWALLADSGARLLAGSDFPIEVIEPLVSLARLVNGRSDRTGFAGPGTAPAQSRLPVRLAVELCTDPAAGRTLLSADPMQVPAANLDQIEIRGTEPAPFS